MKLLVFFIFIVVFLLRSSSAFGESTFAGDLKEVVKKNNIIEKIVEKYGREDINRVCQYIRDNKDSFKGEVYGPIISEVVFQEPI